MTNYQLLTSTATLGLVLMFAGGSFAQSAGVSDVNDPQTLAELREAFAKMKLEHDEAVSELRELKATLDAQNAAQASAEGVSATTPSAQAAPATAGQATTPPTAMVPQDQPAPAGDTPVTNQDAAAMLDRLSQQQRLLETQIDLLLVRQRQLDQQTAAADRRPTSDTAAIQSPYAYRYERTEERLTTPAAPQQNPQPAVAAQYTTYSNGYSTNNYVPPTTPTRTVAQPVYVNTTNVYRSYYPPQPTYIYHSSPYYVVPRHHYSQRHYRSGGGLTIGVVGGKSFFSYRSGGIRHISGHGGYTIYH